MTLEELEAKLDEIAAATDEAVRSTLITDLKVDMRTYKEERDKTEEDNLARITALESDVADRDNTIEEVRAANTKLADKYGKALLKIDEEDNSGDNMNVDEIPKLEELVERFD